MVGSAQLQTVNIWELTQSLENMITKTVGKSTPNVWDKKANSSWYLMNGEGCIAPNTS